MPTKKPRVTFAISEARLSEVEAYQLNNKLKNQSQAILSLIEKGLADFLTDEERKTPSYLDEGEEKLVELYRALNEEGQERLLESAEVMVDSKRYKKGRAIRVDAKEA